MMPVLVQGLRGEFDRWRAAKVMEVWLDGDRKQAIDDLNTILQRLPEDHRLKLVLGEWLLDDRQAERALTLVREIPEQYRDWRSMALVQHCFLAMGQPDQALREYQEANPPKLQREPDQAVFHKNSLAYFQALAGQDLPLALRNSNFVVNQVAGLWNNQQQIPMSAHVQGLFCSAIVYRNQMQRYRNDPTKKSDYADRAITILSGSIAHLEDEYETMCRNEQSVVQKVTNAFLWIVDLPNDDQSDIADKRKEDAAHALATLLTVRALIYQDIGQDDKSVRDRRRVLQIGYQPEQLADMMPSFSDGVFQLELVAMVLDTRGCVHYQMDDIPAALADLNIAVIGQEALVDVAEFRPRTDRQTSLDPRQQFEQFVRGSQRTLAALLFHRSWARHRAGDKTGAFQDVARIRALGFVPGNYLF